MTKPLFTKKHYEAIAKMFAMSEKENPNSDGTLEFYVLARELKKDNPKFGQQKFQGIVNKYHKSK